VSRVFYGRSNVDEQTRARVVAAVQTLGYRPNGAARALKSGRFHTVGVIMTSLQTFGNIRTLDAIAQEAAQTDYSVTLLPISDPDARPRVGGGHRERQDLGANRADRQEQHRCAVRLNVRAAQMRQFAGGAGGAPCANARE
jgi:Bacterial regulatory proteins, lacI family